MRDITREELEHLAGVARDTAECMDPVEEADDIAEWQRVAADIDAAMEADSLSGCPLAIEELWRHINSDALSSRDQRNIVLDIFEADKTEFEEWSPDIQWISSRGTRQAPSMTINGVKYVKPY